MRRKLSCFYSVHLIGPIRHWNLFVLEGKLFNRLLLFVILGWYSIPVLIWKTTIKKICKTCHFHLTNTSKIRSYLDRESTIAIIHAFVTTNLDYCNAILYGLPKVLFNHFKLVQNRAARIVTFTKKYEHITPSLIDLHWLPLDYRISYKILLLGYKAINGFSPSYISNLLSFCCSSYSLRSCSNKLV